MVIVTTDRQLIEALQWHGIGCVLTYNRDLKEWVYEFRESHDIKRLFELLSSLLKDSVGTLALSTNGMRSLIPEMREQGL